MPEVIYRLLYSNTGKNPKWLGEALGELSAIAGGAAVVLSFVPGGEELAPVLEGVSIVSGAVGAYVDCSNSLDAVCGLDIVAASLAGAGFAASKIAKLGDAALAGGGAAAVSEALPANAVRLATSISRASQFSGMKPLEFLAKGFDIYSVGFGSAALAVSSLKDASEEGS